MPDLRFTQAAIYLLTRLAEPGAAVVFNDTLGAYFFLHERLVSDRLRSVTVDVLNRRGCIFRHPGSPVPIYRITPKGLDVLRRADF